MYKVYSLYLGKEIEIPQKEFVGDDGEVVRIIPSQTLEDIITNDVICRERGVRRRFTQLSTGEPGHYAFICAIYDDNRYVEAVGETLPATLTTKIAQDYPVLMASKRAFGEAAIKFLGIPKAMSDSAYDMSEMDGNLKASGSTKPAPTAETSDEAFAALQDVVPPDDMFPQDHVMSQNDVLSLDDVIPVEEPPKAAPKETPVAKPAAKKETAQKEPEKKPSVKAEGSVKKADNSIYDTTIVTAGKLKGQNLSVRQAYEKDANAIRWIVYTMTPRTEAYKILQKICADFLESIGDTNG